MADPLTGILLSQMSPEVLLIISLAALAIGSVLAFLGKLMWKPLMALIGGFIGMTIGFVIGLMLGGEIVGMILAILGGAIGGKLFSVIVEFALAVIAGIVALGLTELITGSLVLAGIVGIIVLIICIKFRDEVVGVLMAIIGSLIAGVGLMGLGMDIGISAVVALIMMITGAVVQTIIIKDKKKGSAARRCPSCGAAMSRNSGNGLWYCPRRGMGGLPPAP